MEHSLFSQGWLVGMSVLGIICLICILVIGISLISSYAKEKKADVSVPEGVVAVLAIIGFVLSIPFICDFYTAQNFGTEKAVKVLNVVKGVAVVPHVKSLVYYELSNNYLELRDGKNAINAYEKAVRAVNKGDSNQKRLICPVYFWSGNSKQVRHICAPNLIAADYLRAKDYDNALKTLNGNIPRYEKDKKKFKSVCEAKALRSIVYKERGNSDLKKADYDFVKNSCKKYKDIVRYVDATNVFDVYMGGNKYKF